MNFRYFACRVCKTYTNAGYRWAYWHLEHPGLVRPNMLVEVPLISQANDYWHPPGGADSRWLYERVFPTVKKFLSEHCDHGIIFVESGDFFALEDFDSWVELESF